MYTLRSTEFFCEWGGGSKIGDISLSYLKSWAILSFLELYLQLFCRSLLTFFFILVFAQCHHTENINHKMSNDSTNAHQLAFVTLDVFLYILCMSLGKCLKPIFYANFPSFFCVLLILFSCHSSANNSCANFY